MTTDTGWHTYSSDGKNVYIDGEPVPSTWPSDNNNEPEPFPRTNRETRRHCDHQFKRIGARTACVHCGKDFQS